MFYRSSIACDPLDPSGRLRDSIKGGKVPSVSRKKREKRFVFSSQHIRGRNRFAILFYDNDPFVPFHAA